jgi:hypothetical protein
MTTRSMPPGDYETYLEERLTTVREGRLRRRTSTRQRGLAATTKLLAAGFVALALMTMFTMSVFGDGGTVNVVVPDKSQCASGVTNDGALIDYIGVDCNDLGAAGSGVFASFVRMQASPTEQGYNTDGRPLEFDENNSATFTHSILVSDIPVVTDPGHPGVFYWEVYADINDSNAKNDESAKNISLNKVEIYLTGDHAILGYPFSGAANKVYGYDGDILIKDVNGGSGQADLRYRIPLSDIDVPANCGYKDPACSSYFVLYSQWGETSGYASDSGFEEWKVKSYPYLTVSKTATTTFTRTYNWSIDKSVKPSSWNLFDGDTGTSDYSVDVTKTGHEDSNWAVNGTITIDNPSGQDASIASVSDVISGVGSVTPDCGVTFPYTLADGDTLECTYSSPLPDGADRTNTATVSLTDGPSFMGTADVTFGSPTTEVNASVDVTDTQEGSLGSTSDTHTFTYSHQFDCSSVSYTDGKGSYKYDNTAEITQTGQQSSASVSVDCYKLDVAKDASTSSTRTYNWTISKSVDPSSWSLFDGDTGTSDYSVTVTKTGYTDSAFHVSGNITISNPNPDRDADLTQVVDSMTGGVDATVDCGGSLTVPAGDSLVCTYSADLPDGTTRTNTATATQQNYDFASDKTATDSGTTDYSGTHSVDFSGATLTEVNASVDVTDTKEGSLGSASDTKTFNYSHKFDCSSVDYTDGKGSYKYDNTAEITQTGQQSSASVSVDCYKLDVAKTADTSLTRTYSWSILKSSDDPNGHALTLNPGESYVDYPYSVTVDMTGYVDSNWAVSGNITISNPNPDRDADLTQVVDSMTGPIDGAVVCPSLTVPAGDSLVCTYSADLPDATTRTNTATATQQNYDFASDLTPTDSGTKDYSGTHSVDFSGATINEVDESIDVTDTYAGDLGTVTYGVDTLPKTFTYNRTFGPYTDQECGDHTIDNTATYTTNDTGTTGDSSWEVVITVPCPTGCTLTQGYWKTHNDSFKGGAPTDPTWLLLGPDAENTTFYLSGQTWFEVFWTSPKGGNAYYILAHQYEAAVLNQLSGAASTTDVDAAIAWAEDFFTSHTPSDKLSKTESKDAKYYAGILDQYNTGLIGPGHCSEDSIASAPTVPAAATASLPTIPVMLLMLFPLTIIPLVGFLGLGRRSRKQKVEHS